MSLDSFPVFKPYQALTAEHLNDLREYLDHEDKITRRALIGIGVACGFDLDVDASGRVLISKGVAVTSHGFVITSEAVICDRRRAYAVPIPTGDDVSDAVIAEARYPALFPGGGGQIDAWEMLTTEVQIPAGEAAPTALTPAFLADKTVMLFLECTEESLRNCDVNDCADKGAQLQFALRRLLIRRDDADRIMAAEAATAGFPTDRANHPGLSLKYLRVEDLGLARLGIGAFPGLIGRIVQIALRFSDELPVTLRALWSAYGHLMRDMYPPDDFPEGPFPDGYFGNVWGQLFSQPFLAQQFYGYMLDVAMACNEAVAAARALEAECLPDPARFPRHVLVGDPKPKARGFVTEVGSAAAFTAWDPGAASSGFGPHPRPARRRTPWTPARPGPALAEFRALFHRLTLLAHAFELRELIGAEIRVTPSRHGAAPLGERCIPPHYAFDQGGDLFRVWSPGKTRANLLNTVYAHRFSARDGNHPYLFRIDGEDFHAIAGHVGRDLTQVIAELAEHKRVLGLDFAIEPVWMGLAAADDAAGLKAERATAARAMQAVRKLIFCRMGDFEVVILGLLAALILFLVWLIRAISGQRMLEFGGQRLALAQPTGIATESVEQPSIMGFAMRKEAAAAMVEMAEREAVRASSDFAFAMKRLPKAERELVDGLSKSLGDEVRAGRFVKGDAVRAAAPEAAERQDTLAALYVKVEARDAEGALFDRVQAALGTADTAAGANVQSVYRAVALVDATETLIAKASARSLAELDAPGLETAYAGFADQLASYAAVAPKGGVGVSAETAALNTAIAEQAPAVSAQASLLSGAGLFGEMERRMQAIFESLTLEGYAKRHPGLEHRGGVPAGGTLVLAYASKRELASLIRVGSRLDRAVVGIRSGATDIETGLASAAQEIVKVAGPTSADPLSEFVVLADFCLPSKCCDADCTEVALDDRARPDIFDLEAPGSMGVAPILPNGVAAEPRKPDGVDRERAAIFEGLGVGKGRRPTADGATDLEAARRRAERAEAEAAAAEAERARLARDAERAAAEAAERAADSREAARLVAERLAERERQEADARRAEEAAARDAEESARRRAAERAEVEARRREEDAARQRERDETQRREEEEARRREAEAGGPSVTLDLPTRSVRAGSGVLTGVATGAGRLASTPVPGARVVVTAEDGRTAAELTAGDDGGFKAALPPGRYEVAVEAEGFAPTRARVAVTAGDDAEVALRMKRAPAR